MPWLRLTVLGAGMFVAFVAGTLFVFAMTDTFVCHPQGKHYVAHRGCQ